MTTVSRSSELKVIAHINPVTDALIYFTRRVNGSPISAEVKTIRDQYPESRENIDALFGVLEELEARLDQVTASVDEERLRFYFTNMGSPVYTGRIHSPNLACGVMMPLPGIDGEYQGFDAYMGTLTDLPERNIIFRLRTAFVIPNEGWNPSQPMDFTGFFDYLSAFPAKDEERYRVLGALRNYDSYLAELKELVRPAVEAIEEALPMYAPLLEMFDSGYQGKTPEEALSSGDDPRMWDRDADVVAIRPCLFTINDHYKMTYRYSADSPTCCEVEEGLLYSAAKQYGKREIPTREIAGHLKAIADPIRLQILMLLRDEEVYVQDLTKKLDLSFTTVSHHMTKLMMAGLVTSERRGVYVYYKPNREFIQWILDRLRELLI